MFMDRYQKDEIYTLIDRGFIIDEISQITDVPAETIKTLLKRHPVNPHKDVCRFCGKPLQHTKGKMKKIYCSDLCRLHYNRQKQRFMKLSAKRNEQ